MIIMIEADEARKWLERRINLYTLGGCAKLAKELGVSISTISRMRYGGPITGKVAAALNIEKVRGEDRYIYTIPDDQRY